MSGQRRVVQNVLALLVTQLGTWSVTLVSIWIVPPYLGPTRYGLFAFVGSYVGLFALGMNLGTGTYLTWRIAREPHSAGRLTFNTLVLQLPLAVICGTAALVALSLIDNSPVTMQLGFIAVTSTALGTPCATCVSALSGLQDMRTPSLIGLMGSAIGTGLAIAGVVAHLDVVAIAAAGLIGQVGACVVLFAYMQRRIHLAPRLDLRLWRTIVLGGLPFLTWSVVLLIYGQIDISMLKVMVGNSEVGWYSAAYRIIGIPIFLPTIVTTALLPALSAARSPNAAQFRELVSRSIRVVLLVGIPCCAGTVLLATNILHFLHYPASFNGAIPLIRILALHMPIVGLDVVLGTMLIAIGRQKAWTGVGVIAAIFNPLVNLWAIPYTQHVYGNGAIGASIVTVLTEVLMLCGALVLRPRSIITLGDILYITRCVVATAIMVPAVWALRQAGIGLLPAVAYGAIIYSVAAYTLHVVRNEDLFGVANIAARKVVGSDLTQINLKQLRERLRPVAHFDIVYARVARTRATLAHHINASSATVVALAGSSPAVRRLAARARLAITSVARVLGHEPDAHDAARPWTRDVSDHAPIEGAIASPAGDSQRAQHGDQSPSREAERPLAAAGVTPKGSNSSNRPGRLRNIWSDSRDSTADEKRRGA